MSPQPKDRRGPALPSHDDFAQLLAREEKLHGFKTLKELFQAAIIEELDGGAQAALREQKVFLIFDPERVQRNLTRLFIGMEICQQIALRTHDHSKAGKRGGKQRRRKILQHV